MQKQVLMNEKINKMKTVTLNIGGDLAPGDFVGVAYNHCIVFGWYVQQGQYGSLQYLSINEPERVKEQYNEYLKGKTASPYWDKQFGKGLQFRNFRKDFIVSYSGDTNRAFKVPNPEEFLKGTEQELLYLSSKKVLNDINFPAK